MSTKTAYQINASGILIGTTVVDESPLEPGVWLLPPRVIETPPPDTWPDDKWPRFNGSAWELVNKPTAQQTAEISPAEKLAAFLSQNPDVAALIDSTTTSTETSSTNQEQ